LFGYQLAKAQEVEAHKKKAAGGSDPEENNGTTIEVLFIIAVTVNQLHRCLNCWRIDYVLRKWC